ncbi:DUF2280 domain-containing protein [Sinorhizobium meliloti]|nr:DUF2280 domain-containing protein [Sinorhizobium meliloti]
MAKAKFCEEVKTFIVQRVACFDPASIVDDAVGWIRRTITHQSVEGYHPTKKAGRNRERPVSWFC